MIYVALECEHVSRVSGKKTRGVLVEGKTEFPLVDPNERTPTKPLAILWTFILNEGSTTRVSMPTS
jgi:hypothetical protein